MCVFREKRRNCLPLNGLTRKGKILFFPCILHLQIETVTPFKLIGKIHQYLLRVYLIFSISLYSYITEYPS